MSKHVVSTQAQGAVSSLPRSLLQSLNSAVGVSGLEACKVSDGYVGTAILLTWVTTVWCVTSVCVNKKFAG